MTLTVVKCRHKRNQDGTWSAFLVPIFVTHTRGDIVYDRARLDLIAENTRKSDRIKGRPKVIVHHSGDYTGPNVGRLADVKRIEDLLFADYVNIRPAVFMNWVKDGYPGRSVQLDPVTFDRIEAIAFLGDEEPYFPLSPVEFDLSEDEMAQLAADVAADTSFAHAYARPAKKPAKKAAKKKAEPRKVFMRREDLRKLAQQALAGKDEQFDVSAYLLEPEDAQDMIAVVEELTAPLKEGIAMLNARLEAVEQQADLQEAVDDGAGEQADEGEEDPDAEGGDEEGAEDDAEGDGFEREGDEEADDTEADSARDDEEDPEKDSERDEGADEADSERDDEEEKDMSTRARGKTQSKGKPAKPAKKPAKPAATSDLSTFERLVKAEAKNARHQGEQTFADYQRRITEVLDPAIEEDVDAKAQELTEELYKLSEADRPQGLEILLNAYKANGVPTAKLPRTKKDPPKAGKDLETRAREYHREHKRVMKANYLGLKEDDFVKQVSEADAQGEDDTRFMFLRG